MRQSVPTRALILLCLLGLCVAERTASAGVPDAVKRSFLYYENCEDRKPPAGVRVEVRPEGLVPGKFGRGFRMERRTRNLLADPEFRDARMKAWTAVGKPERLVAGGLRDPGCVRVDSANYVRQVVPADLNEAYPHAFSVYMKALSPGAQGVVRLRVGPATRETKAPLSTTEWTRLSVGVPKAACEIGVVDIAAVGGAALADAVQVEEGSTYATSYVPCDRRGRPGRRRRWDIIQVGREAGPLDRCARGGSFALWYKANWFGEQVTPRMGLSILRFDMDKAGGGPTTYVALAPYRGVVHATISERLKRGRRTFGVTSPREAKWPRDQWRHLAITWDFRDFAKAKLNLYIDGRGVAARAGIRLLPLQGAHGLHIGRSADAVLDEIALFDRPLTPTEVKQVYESGGPLLP